MILNLAHLKCFIGIFVEQGWVEVRFERLVHLAFNVDDEGVKLHHHLVPNLGQGGAVRFDVNRGRARGEVRWNLCRFVSWV